MNSSRAEALMEGALAASGLTFSRPDHEHGHPTNLDFYLPDFNLYVEVKDYPTDRLCRQLKLLPDGASAMILIGLDSAMAFLDLVRALCENNGGRASKVEGVVASRVCAGSSPVGHPKSGADPRRPEGVVASRVCAGSSPVGSTKSGEPE